MNHSYVLLWRAMIMPGKVQDYRNAARRAELQAKRIRRRSDVHGIADLATGDWDRQHVARLRAGDNMRRSHGNAKSSLAKTSASKNVALGNKRLNGGSK